MPSTFWGLNIAVSGMSTYQAGLNTTAHNISNIGTKGYTKQSVIQSAKKALYVPTYGMLGAGVNVDDIVSSRSTYYDTKYWQNNAVLGNYSTKDYYMQTIEDALYTSDEDTGSITTAFNGFFNAVTDLTNDESDTTLRTQVSVSASTFAAYVNEVASTLQTLQTEINNQMKIVVDAVNSISQELASLTKQIAALEVYGTKANDLRDQRATLIDELSQYATTSATEIEPEDGNGLTQYIVTFGNYILVDTYNYNELVLTARQTKNNQNDAEGLYDISWSNGLNFPMDNTQLGGTLQALIELRDGNNQENFCGKLTAYSEQDPERENKATITITSSEVSWPNASNLNLLNLPESEGVININNREYVYDYFDVEIKTDGTYVYTFALKDEIPDSDILLMDNAVDDGVTAAVGESIDYKGIPYYMAKLNEFTRIFSANVNEILNEGYDLYGNSGVDMFVGVDKVTGEQFSLNEMIYNNTDGHYYLNDAKMITSDEQSDYEADGYVLEPVSDDEEDEGYFHVMDDEGNIIEKVYVMEGDTRYVFNSKSGAESSRTYYSITALNYEVNDELLNDAKKLACAKENPVTISGVEDGRNLERLYKLKSDTKMFREGDPIAYLQVVVATVGVDAAKVKDFASNQQNIVDAVYNSRLSVSGVDEDEEATNLVMLQNMLSYQYHVIDVQQQVLDALLNMAL